MVDLDFTGKLDLLLIPPETNSVRVLRNLGNMYFKDVTSTSGVPASLTTARRLVTEDWNNDDIMDVWVVRDGQPPLVLVKERGGPLTDTNSPVGWPAGTAIAAGDLNNDLRNDAVIAAPGRLECVFAGITNRLRLATGGFAVSGLDLVDYDNDGWLDICARGNGVRVWRNLGLAGFRETTAELRLDKIATGQVDQVALADFDNDGDTDFLLGVQNGGLKLLRNEGGNANQQIKLRLLGNRSNFTGLGVRIEVTAGNWRTIRTVTELPIEIGVGQHKQLDSLNIRWVDVAAPSAEVPVDPRSPGHMDCCCPRGRGPISILGGEGFSFIRIFSSGSGGLPLPRPHVEADPDNMLGLERRFVPAARRLLRPPDYRGTPKSFSDEGICRGGSSGWPRKLIRMTKCGRPCPFQKGAGHRRHRYHCSAPRSRRNRT